VSRPTVLTWRGQFEKDGLIGFGEVAKGRGRKPSISDHILADTAILYSLYKKHHWLMRGHTFYQLHLLLDKHTGEQLELIDLIAERVQTLGAVAVGDPRHVAEITTIPRQLALGLVAHGVHGFPGSGGELQVEPGVGVVEVVSGHIANSLQPVAQGAAMQ
jgi:Ferritin-like domain